MTSATHPEPCYFGEPARPLFGWLYRPRFVVPGAPGLVLCNPFGYDAVSAHRSLRRLASVAAQAGIPTLRFDYYATGDSAGEDTDPQLLQAWIASVGHAVNQLREQSAVSEVCLFGMRLGALLALVAAQNHPEVSAFIGLNPVISGRRYVRELKALAATSAAASLESLITPGLNEAAGFAMSDATRGAVQELELSSIGKLPLRRALLITRADLPKEDSLATALQSQGIPVTHQPFAGYAEMMLDAHETVVPQEMFRELVAWITKAAPPTISSEASARRGNLATTAEFEHNGVSLRESASFLDAEHRLFGIISGRAAAHPGAQSRQVLLLPNSGAVTHTGPNRLYVQIARTFAAAGATVIRFDLTGLGDTAPRPGEPDNVVYGKHAVDEIRVALEFARQLVRDAELHLAGICSGAYHSLKASLVGPPLHSISVINPLVFFYKQGMSLAQPDFQVISEARRYKRRSLQLSSWVKVLRGRVNLFAAAAVVLKRVVAQGRNSARELARRLRLPVRDDLAAELRLVARRGTRTLFAFAASDPGLALLREEGGRAVDDLQQRQMLEIAIIEGADHTFTRRRSQQALLRVLTEHLARTPPGSVK